MPIADALIAATARAHRIGVLTCDLDDFHKLSDVLDGFPVIDPVP